MLVNELPFVSIIVPARNEEDCIGECLESLLRQDYPKARFEMIVVDNASTDRTASIIRQFPVQYLFEKKRGAACARNAGARVAQGDLLAFTDSDCIAPPDWVRRLARTLEESAADACGGDYVVDSSSSLIEDHFAFREIYSQRQFFTPSSPFPPWLLTGNLMVRRGIFQKVGGIEETLFLGEDIDLSWKIAGEGGRLEYVPGIKVIHQESPSLIHFYFKNFQAGRATFLLNRRYELVFSQKKEKPWEPLRGLFRKLKAHCDRLFSKENNRFFSKKWAHLFLIGTGHFAFLMGQGLSRISYDILKKPLPVPILQRQSAFVPPSLEPQTA